jgi:hypothetical protein
LAAQAAAFRPVLTVRRPLLLNVLPDDRQRRVPRGTTKWEGDRWLPAAVMGWA